jgi:DNA-nicking Smr family endonuclease
VSVQYYQLVAKMSDSDPHEIPIEHTLDLHPFAPRDIPSVVDEYLRAAHERGLREVRLIHGRGKGVQRGIVQNVLEKHPLVEEFWDATETHLGATVAKLSQIPDR